MIAKAAEPLRFLPDNWRQNSRDHVAFIEASLSTDRRKSLAARKLSSVLETLCLLSAEERRGFVVAAQNKVNLLADRE